jgi:catechol 2,3-dioxygenase-like lactoylglutathione lyase family enzyme
MDAVTLERNLLGLDAPGQTESALDRDTGTHPTLSGAATTEEETEMTFEIGHVHLKCADPKKTADYYINNFGGKLLAEIPGRGFRVDLHGLQLNITVKIDTQNHAQYLGIEHLAVQTDDYASTMATVRKNGVKVLEELNNNGRHVAFLEAPDGAQMEVIEKV